MNDFMPLHSECKSKSTLLNDIANHCPNWRTYMVKNSISTSTHEMSHGVSAYLRNEKITFEKSGGDFESLPLPIRDGYFGSRANAFYLFNNSFQSFSEPKLRKGQVASFIPSELRLSRFSTYITGQTAWDDTPLYIMDEWNAYIAGTEAALELARKGDMENKGTDIGVGPLEFLYYSLALCDAINRYDADYFSREPEFLKFINSQAKRAKAASTECQKYFPWDSISKLLTINTPLNKYLNVNKKISRKDFDV